MIKETIKDFESTIKIIYPEVESIEYIETKSPYVKIKYFSGKSSIIDIEQLVCFDIHKRIANEILGK